MRYFLSTTGLVAGLAATGFLYQWFGAHFDRLRYARRGRWIDIGDGRRLYLLEKGSGDVTVLFESGIAATNLNWFHIQEQVSHTTTTASYDRAGLGWSSPSRTARTPGNIAAELHQLLAGAGIKPPYILVGHSFGGLVVRRFALLYPEEVSSVVLVDPMRCDEWPPLDPTKQAMLDRDPEALELCNSDCTTGIGPACGDLAVVPLRAHRRSIGSRCRRGGQARARADQARGR